MEITEVYQSSICKLHVREKRLQEQCDVWCRTYTGCHVHIAQQSQEAQKLHEGSRTRESCI
jgi:hypothetical protein